MENQHMENIDFLRERADLSYEEAVVLLERFDGDVTRCIIELERQGKLKQAAQTGQQDGAGADGQTEDRQRAYEAHRARAARASNILFAHVRVMRGERMLINLPFIVLLIGALFSLRLTVCAILLLFLTGCRVHWRKGEATRWEAKSFHVYADQVAENIRCTADSVANAVKGSTGANKDEAQGQ